MNAKNMLALAKCDLSIAKVGKITDEIRYQALITLCQQVMEKSLKALLIQNDIEYPKNHSLTNLTKYIEMKGIVLPEFIKISAGSTVLEGGVTFPLEFPMTCGAAVPLSQYAGNRRYSFSEDGEPDEQEYQNMIKRTENVVNWVEKNLEKKNKSDGIGDCDCGREREMTGHEKNLIRNSTAEFLIFTSTAGEESIEVRYEDETIWLSQKMMAALFDVGLPNVNEHLKNIYESGELTRDATIRKFRIVQSEGNRDVSRNLEYYNLDAIISVGYRINSKRATQFRQWATRVVREFAVKGYVLDKKRMENGKFLGEDYFERLLAEIREIRLSERRFYQKITDIYSTSIDYNRNAPTTRDFFAKVQNKLHFAIHGHTAAELIIKRANSRTDHMGLTSWENSPDGKILKTDVVVAKNYLTSQELESLGGSSMPGLILLKIVPDERYP